MDNIRRVIYGIESMTLSVAEKDFYSSANPAGFILFKRNVDNPGQLKSLINELHECTSNPYLHILIDQEGGRVARLKPPHFRKSRPASDFAKLGVNNIRDAQKAVFFNHYLMGKELTELGINVNCAPMCDILFEGAHDIVGDRSFGSNKKNVIALAKAAINGLCAANIIPIIKHIPGHGRSLVDSHEDLPRVTEDLEVLEQSDFAVFNALAFAPWAMTAHIIYDAIDPENCATHSKAVISYIREEIGFNNILVSDDICMKALDDSLAVRAQKAITAGCDLVLHCKGTLDEYQSVAEVCGLLTEPQIKLIKNGFKFCQKHSASKEHLAWIDGKEVDQLEQELKSFFI